MLPVGLKDTFSLSLVIVVQSIKARLKTEPLEMSEVLGVMFTSLRAENCHWTLFFMCLMLQREEK